MSHEPGPSLPPRAWPAAIANTAATTSYGASAESEQKDGDGDGGSDTNADAERRRTAVERARGYAGGAPLLCRAASAAIVTAIARARVVETLNAPQVRPSVQLIK